MNEQMEQFKNLIEFAKMENGKGAVTLLREICRESADKAPVEDLIKISQFLFDLRMEAARSHIETN